MECKIYFEQEFDVLPSPFGFILGDSLMTLKNLKKNLFLENDSTLDTNNNNNENLNKTGLFSSNDNQKKFELTEVDLDKDLTTDKSSDYLKRKNSKSISGSQSIRMNKEDYDKIEPKINDSLICPFDVDDILWENIG